MTEFIDHKMKPINAYLNIHNGKVVASTEQKPEYRYVDSVFNVPYEMKLKTWQSSILGEVVNASEHDCRVRPGNIVVNPDSPDFEVVKLGHPCQVEVWKEVTVIKLK